MSFPSRKEPIVKRKTPEPDYGTGVLNKRKKTVFTGWPDKSFKPSEVIEATTQQVHTESSDQMWRILLHIAGSSITTVGVDIWRVIVLGRRDPTGNYNPDVDFASYSGMRLGVSRRHALIKPDLTGLALVDQKSVNGTWINGKRLSPGRATELKDGDRVELGDLKFTVRIMNTPVTAR